MSAQLRTVVIGTKAVVLLALTASLVWDHFHRDAETVARGLKAYQIVWIAIYLVVLALSVMAGLRRENRLRFERRPCLGAILVAGLLLIANLYGFHPWPRWSGWRDEIHGSDPREFDWVHGWPRTFLERDSTAFSFDYFSRHPLGRLRSSRWPWDGADVCSFNGGALIANVALATVLIAATYTALQRPATSRRRFQFSLRSLLVTISFLCVALSLGSPRYSIFMNLWYVTLVYFVSLLMGPTATLVHRGACAIGLDDRKIGQGTVTGVSLALLIGAILVICRI